MKVCSKCNLNLPLSSYSKSSGANYVRPECKDCNNRLSRERTELRKQYGMPEDGYKCPICLRGVEELQGRGGNAGVWVVDHDHATNTFRGHLCHSCNRAIGMFQDSVENLKRAIDYLS